MADGERVIGESDAGGLGRVGIDDLRSLPRYIRAAWAGRGAYEVLLVGRCMNQLTLMCRSV